MDATIMGYSYIAWKLWILCNPNSYGLGQFRDAMPVVENQTEKRMGNEMKTVKAILHDPSTYAAPS